MKILIAIIGALSAAPLVPAAASQVDSAIAAVTVYTDRAVVTRVASVKLSSGISELVFASLPQSLNESSLQVSGGGAAQATILDVSTKQTFVDFNANPRIKELDGQLKNLGKEMRSLEDRNNLLQAQSKLLDQMEASLFAPPAKDAPRPDMDLMTKSLAYFSEQKARISTEHAAFDEQKEDLNNKIGAVQSQLNELRGGGGRGFKSVTVRVSAANAGGMDIALSYMVPGAGWTPNYDARVISGKHAVDLSYFGIVRQSTGEDWKDVALTLSTARPGLGGAAPVLSVWNIDVFTPPPPTAAAAPGYGAVADKVARRDARKAGEGNVNMQTMTNAAPNPASAEDQKDRDAEMAAATIEAGATSASFKIAAPATIPSDNSPQKVPITSVQLTTNPEYLTVPKRLAAAFLTAKVENTSDFPLLAGTMHVFLDDTFVATSAVRTVMNGEKFDLALGADEGIGVKFKRLNKFTEDTGLINSGKRITYDYLITIQNNKTTQERVIVADQVPISRNEKIVVKLISSDVKPTDEGTLKWSLDLKPGEKRELKLKYAVEYPNDVTVTGLD